MVMSVGGEAAPGRGKGRDDVSWPDANLTEPKFSSFKWTVKILSNDE
jgi:hypothetical protein